MKRNRGFGRVCNWAVYGGLSLFALTTVVKVADKKLHSSGGRENLVVQREKDGYSLRSSYIYTPLFLVGGACVLAGAGAGFARSGFDGLDERVR